jgi:hypothetical protein
MFWIFFLKFKIWLKMLKYKTCFKLFKYIYLMWLISSNDQKSFIVIYVFMRWKIIKSFAKISLFDGPIVHFQKSLTKIITENWIK